MGLFRKKQQEKPFVTVIITAAGASRRMGGGNKQLMSLGGIPVLGRTMLAFENSDYVREIIVTAPEDQVVPYADLGASLGISKLKKVVKGGTSRLESAYLGACEAAPACDYLAVHDGARPLVTGQIIADVCEAAFAHTAAGAGVPVHDTVKQVDGERRITQTVDRDRLMAMQTPQMADRALLLAAMKKALDEGAEPTDECAALERMGVHPLVVESSFENLKITTPIDLLFAEAILQERGSL